MTLSPVSGSVFEKILSSERARKGAAVDENILAGDVAGLRRAEERAGRAELVRLADAPRRDGGDALGERGFGADALLLRHRRDVSAQTVGAENSRQDEIDGDIRGGDRAGDAGEKGGQSGPRAGRQVEARERHPHRSRGDID